MCRFTFSSLALSFLSLFAATSQGAIYQWGWVDPGYPSAGKQQTSILCPDGAGVIASLHRHFQGYDLTKAYLPKGRFSGDYFYGATLTSAYLPEANLTKAHFSRAILNNADLTKANLTKADFSKTDFSNADLTGADLTETDFTSATLTDTTLKGCYLNETKFYHTNFTGADLTGAILKETDFSRATNYGFTREQLYSTKNYQDKNLSGINLEYNDLSYWSFTGQDLTGTRFDYSSLEEASFSGAVIQETNFGYASSFAPAQLYSTKSYQDKNLAGIRLNGNDLTGWNFAGQNLTAASFWYAKLTDANFTGATIKEAAFAGATRHGFTSSQLYSTQSYQDKDLTGVNLSDNDLTGWDFSGQNLTDAYFGNAILTDADMTASVINKAIFGSSLSSAQLYSTKSYLDKDLSDVHFRGDLTGWNLAGQNLTNVVFWKGDLTDADFSGTTVKNTQFHKATDNALTETQLYSTRSYRDKDLTGIGLMQNDLTGWNFAGQNLTNARFWEARLIGADFTGAVLKGTSFWNATLTGASLAGADLKDTSFDKAKLDGANLAGTDLRRTVLVYADLTGANLSGTNLKSKWLQDTNMAGVDLSGANITLANFNENPLIGVNLNGADGRKARIDFSSAASTRNFIRPDGTVEGIQLGAGESMRIWDYDLDQGEEPLPICVVAASVLEKEAKLRMAFDDDAWHSTITFDENGESGTDISLGGMLELVFEQGINPTILTGTTYRLFDWTGANRTGTFDEILTDGYLWDTSNLYTSGEVTFCAVPEPSTIFLLLTLAAGLALRLRGRRNGKTILEHSAQN